MNEHAILKISGLRGVWGETLTEETIRKYVQAFATYILKEKGKKVIVGRDARMSGKQIERIVIQILTSFGIDVTLIEIEPSPTLIFLVRKHNFDGGVIITASHNPPEYNGLKFIQKGGTFIEEDAVKEINSFVTKDFTPQVTKDPGSIKNWTNAWEDHILEILKNVDVSLISSKHYKVVLDPVNSTGAIATPPLLRALGCEVKIIHGEITGLFERHPEPRDIYLNALSKKIIEEKADIGFAQDPDADRLVFADETGFVLSEEYTQVIGMEAILDKEGGTLVATNLSSSQMVDDVAKRYKAEVIRTYIGEMNVTKVMQEKNILIGGEGNGGIIYPKINYVRDSLVGIALVLELMAKKGKSLSEIVTPWPKYFMDKRVLHLEGNENIEKLFEGIINVFPLAKIDRTEGIRLSSEDNWLHARPSNTEPLLRIFVEAKNQKETNKIFETIEEAVQSAWPKATLSEM